MTLHSPSLIHRDIHTKDADIEHNHGTPGESVVSRQEN